MKKRGVRGRRACERLAPLFFVASALLMSCGATGGKMMSDHDAAVEKGPDQSDSRDALQDLPSPTNDGPADAGNRPFPAPSLGPRIHCNPSSPFGPPSLIEGFTDPGVTGPNYALTFSSDLLTVFALRSATAGFTVFMASRPTLESAFGPLQASRTATGVQPPLFMFMSDDSLRLYTNPYVYTRSSATQPDFDMTRGFDSPLSPNPPYWVSPDQTRIYYGGGVGAISVADLHDLTLTSARALAALDGAPATGPVLTRDELTIYFSSLRPRGSGEPSWDIYMASRARVADDFEPPELVAELSSEAQDRIDYVSPEGCTVYLFRHGMGPDQYLQASRGP